MASLQNIKTRISSIKSTRKITKAMEMVASAKLKTSKKNLNNIQEYYFTVKDIIEDLIKRVDNISEILPKSKTNDSLFIIITSDMGLCGGYNTNIIKLTKSILKQNDKVIIIGGKGFNSFSKETNKILQSYINIGDKPNFKIISKISDEVISSYMTGVYKEVNLIHTKFINSFVQKANITKIFPFEKKENKSKNNLLEIDFEPSAKEVLKTSIPIYFNTILLKNILESKVSEMSARRVAMESASDNADDLIKNLNIQYNKVRQSTITQEINEIIAGIE